MGRIPVPNTGEDTVTLKSNVGERIIEKEIKSDGKENPLEAAQVLVNACRDLLKLHTGHVHLRELRAGTICSPELDDLSLRPT